MLVWTYHLQRLIRNVCFDVRLRSKLHNYRWSDMAGANTRLDLPSPKGRCRNVRFWRKAGIVLLCRNRLGRVLLTWWFHKTAKGIGQDPMAWGLEKVRRKNAWGNRGFGLFVKIASIFEYGITDSRFHVGSRRLWCGLTFELTRILRLLHDSCTLNRR